MSDTSTPTGTDAARAALGLPPIASSPPSGSGVSAARAALGLDPLASGPTDTVPTGVASSSNSAVASLVSQPKPIVKSSLPQDALDLSGLTPWDAIAKLRTAANGGVDPADMSPAAMQARANAAPTAQLMADAEPTRPLPKSTGQVNPLMSGGIPVPNVPGGELLPELTGALNPETQKIGTGPRADAAYAGYIHAITPVAQGGLGADPKKAGRAYRQSMSSMTIGANTGDLSPSPWESQSSYAERLPGGTYSLHPDTFSMLPFNQDAWQKMLNNGQNIVQTKDGKAMDRATAEMLYNKYTGHEGPSQGADDIAQRENQINESGLSPNAGNKLLARPEPMTLARVAQDSGQLAGAMSKKAANFLANVADPLGIVPKPVKEAGEGVVGGALTLANPLSLVGMAAQVVDNPSQAALGLRDMFAKVATPSNQTPEEYFDNLLNAALIAHGVGKMNVTGYTSGMIGDALKKSITGDITGMDQHITEHPSVTTDELLGKKTQTQNGVPIVGKETAEPQPVATQESSTVEPQSPQGRIVDPSGLYALNNWRSIAEADLEHIDQHIAALSGADKQTSRTVGDQMRPVRVALQNALDTNVPPEGLLKEMADNHRATYGASDQRIPTTVVGPDLVPDASDVKATPPKETTEPTQPVEPPKTATVTAPAEDPSMAYARENWQAHAADMLTKTQNQGLKDAIRSAMASDKAPDGILKMIADEHRQSTQAAEPEAEPKTATTSTVTVSKASPIPASGPYTRESRAPYGSDDFAQREKAWMDAFGVKPDEPKVEAPKVETPKEPATVPKVEVPPKVEPEPKEDLTAMRKSVADAERERWGLPPVDMQPYPDMLSDFEKGRKAVDSRAIDPDALADSVIRQPRALNPEERGALYYHKARLVEDYNRLVGDANGTKDPQRLVDLEASRKLKEDALNKLDAVTQAIKMHGRETSAALASLKTVVDHDMNPAVMQTRGKMAKGAPLTSVESAEMDRLGQQAVELKAKLDAAKAADEQTFIKHQKQIQEMRERHEAAIKDIQDKSDKQVEAMRSRQAELKASSMVDKAFKEKTTRTTLAAERQDILKRITQLSSKLSANPIDVLPEGLKLLGELTVNLAKDGALTLDELYSKVKAHLDPAGIEFTKRQMIDAFLDHGKPENARSDASEASKNKAVLKRQALIQTQIDDIHENGIPAPKTRGTAAVDAETQRLLDAKKQAIADAKVGPPKSPIPGAISEPVKAGANDLDDLVGEVQKRLPWATRDDVVNTMLDKKVQSEPTPESKVRADIRKQADYEARAKKINDAVDAGTFAKEPAKPKAPVSDATKRAQEEYNRAVARGNKKLAEMKITPLAEGIKQTIRASMVSGLGIPWKVYKSFAVSKLTDSMSAIPAEGWDRFIKSMTGQRASQIDIDAIRGAIKDARSQQSLGRLASILTGAETSSAHTGVDSGLHGINMGDSKFQRLWSKTVNSEFNMHQALYSSLLDYGYAKSIREQAGLMAKNAKDTRIEQHLIDHPTPKMIARADAEAREGILQNKNVVGSWIANRSGLKDSPIGSLADLAATMVSPVPNIAMNHYGRLLEHTPLGHGEGLIYGVKAIQEARIGRELIAKGETAKGAEHMERSFDYQRQSSKAMGRATIGTFGLIAAGYFIAKHGLGNYGLTGMYSQTTGRQNAAQGGHGNITIPGREPGHQNFTIDDSPGGQALALGALWAELEKHSRNGRVEPETFWQHWHDLRSLQPLVDANPLKESLRSSDNLETFMNRSLASMAVPGLVSSIAKAPWIGDYGTKRATDGVKDEIKARIPWVRQTLPVDTGKAKPVNPLADALNNNLTGGLGKIKGFKFE